MKKLIPVILSLVVATVFAYASCSGSDKGEEDSQDSGPGAPGGGIDGGVPEEQPVPCVADRECGQLGKICDTMAGRCVECLTNAQCLPGDVCSGANCGKASACVSTNDCPETQLCDTNVKLCVDCLGPSDCKGDKACDAQSCRPIIPCTTSKQCSDKNQVCDPVNNYCVDCLANTDCPPASEGLCLDSRCAYNTPCESNAECAPFNNVCDANAQLCVVCLKDGDCAANYRCENTLCLRQPAGPGEGEGEGAPVCTPDCNGKECGDDGCNGSCGACNPGKECLSTCCLAPSGECTDDTGCTADPLRPKCSRQDHRCYPDGHCMIVGCGQQTCNPCTGFCQFGLAEGVPCVNENDCEEGLICTGQGTRYCRRLCTTDTDCTDGAYCDTAAGWCKPKGCTADTDCPDPTKPICNKYSGVCEAPRIECTKDEDCLSEFESHCNTATQRCAQCLDQTQCEEGEECCPNGLCQPETTCGQVTPDGGETDGGEDGGGDSGGPTDTGLSPDASDDGTCDPPCPAGQLCQQYVCYTKPTGNDAGAGDGGGGPLDDCATCATDTDCPQGLKCDVPQFPLPGLEAACKKECTDSIECAGSKGTGECAAGLLGGATYCQCASAGQPTP